MWPHMYVKQVCMCIHIHGTCVVRGTYKYILYECYTCTCTSCMYDPTSVYVMYTVATVVVHTVHYTAENYNLNLNLKRVLYMYTWDMYYTVTWYFNVLYTRILQDLFLDSVLIYYTSLYVRRYFIFVKFFIFHVGSLIIALCQVSIYSCIEV